jgi:hypothetical protein
VIAHFFLDYRMEWLVVRVMCQKSIFLGHERILTLEIRVLKVLHIEVFKYLNFCFLIMSCPLLFHHYTHSIRFWVYNGRFLLSLCLLILCWKVSAKFSRNLIWHTESIIRRAVLFYMKQTRSCCGRGSCRVLVQPSFSFQKISFRGKEKGLLSTSTEHGPKTSAAKSGA